MKKVLLILFMIVSFSGFAQAEKGTSQDDNLILTEVINNTKKILKNEQSLILLSTSMNNNYIIEVIKKYKGEDSDIVSQVDHSDEVLKQIFNEKEYGYLLSQRSDEKWILNTIKDDNVLMYQEDMEIMAPGSKHLIVGKPIYTSDKKYALVYLNFATSLGIDVFKNEGGKWVEYKLIHPFSFQPRAKLKSGYCLFLEKILLNPKVAAYLHGDVEGRKTLYIIKNDFCIIDTTINGILVKTAKDLKGIKSKNYIEIKSVNYIAEETIVELSYPIEGASIKAVFDNKLELSNVVIIEK